MLKIWTVTKNELIRYFVSPLAYVYLFCFVLLNASFATYFGDFFNRGQADLQSMFMFHPWLYLLFIPGISMRLWAEEFHSKTIVQIATQPVSITSLVLGKFFAAWLFCGLALVLTFPFWITVNVLGHPDNFVIFMGYCASFILAGCMLAISQIMSALTKNQIIALVLSVIANLLFFWSGIEYVLSFCRLFLPETLIDVVASFSFLTHFNSLTYGLVEARDVIFFASLICFALYTTALIVNFKTAGSSGWLKSSSKSYTVTAWIMLFIGFFGINILANNLTANLQFDGTAEKNFTLTQSTKNILRHLPEPVVAKLYFSPILERRNSDLRQEFDTIRLLLQKYKSASNGKFDYKIYYPEFLSKEEDIALADGLQSIPLIDLNQTALFGMTIEDTLQNKEVIPFFATSQHGRLEQDITTKIHQLYSEKKTLGILTSLPIFGRESEENVAFNNTWEIINLLQKDYNVHHITAPEDFDKIKFDVLLIMYPKFLSDEVLEKVKQYSQKGGRAVLVLDPANEASRLYAPVMNKLLPSDSEFFEKIWGFKFYKDYVVADLQNSIVVDATINYAENPIFSQDVIQFRLHENNMNPNHPVTKNLQEIMMASASVLMPDMKKYEEQKIVFYPLLRAGEVSEIMTARIVTDGVNPQDILEYFSPDDNQKFLAAEIIGLEPENQFNVIIVGDTDFLYDQFWMDKVMMLESEYVTSIFDNANFLLNALDYLADDTSLLGVRGKRSLSRRFETVEMLRRWNALKYKQKEKQIFDEIDNTKQALQEIWNKKEFEERENFTADELAALSKLRNQLSDFRKQLSDLRGRAYDNINQIASRINFINIWALPILFGLILLLAAFIRFLRRKHRFSFALPINRRLLILTGGCTAILLCAMGSVYIANYSSIDAYANKPVFPQLLSQLNSVNNIVLKSNKQTLHFVQNNDNQWTLQEQPSLPVYQERIRHLLTTIADARYFARKSNKAENLAMFNLLPIEDDKSNAIDVSLLNDDKVMQHFLLGDIGADIGRGGRAAYMRFEDQFQVWEISADFVDMDLDWHKWTYSNMWDLRFGRPYDRYQVAENDMRLTNVVKLMLNTPFESVETLPLNAPIKVLKLFIEGGNYVEVSFYKRGQKSYVSYNFDKNNPNSHLKMFKQFIDNKALVVDSEKMEKILELIE